MQLKHVAARFYLTETGANPVRDWLMKLPAADRQQIGHDIRDVEFGWPVGMPLCRSLGSGLWEVRSTLPSRRIARVLFCVGGNELVLLHGFIKKTQKTPASDLNLGIKRMKEVQS
jgi:phage-related protein